MSAADDPVRSSPSGDGPVRSSPSGDGARIRIKVSAGASRTVLAGRHGDRIRVRVSAPPEGGKANRAVVDLLAERLGVPRRAVRIVTGLASPWKIVEVDGLTADETRERL